MFCNCFTSARDFVEILTDENNVSYIEHQRRLELRRSGWARHLGAGFGCRFGSSNWSTWEIGGLERCLEDFDDDDDDVPPPPGGLRFIDEAEQMTSRRTDASECILYLESLEIHALRLSAMSKCNPLGLVSHLIISPSKKRRLQ